MEKNSIVRKTFILFCLIKMENFDLLSFVLGFVLGFGFIFIIVSVCEWFENYLDSRIADGVRKVECGMYKQWRFLKWK